MADGQDRIEIVPYERAWVQQYEEARAEIRRALGEEIGSLEHIGSTAVPGLASKPVLDLLLGLATFPPAPPVIAALAGLDYEFLGEHGIAGRYFFRKGTPRSQHLHVVRSGSEFWTRHLRFRDLLRAKPALCSEYEALKRGLARRYGADRESYTDAKGDFIRRALAAPDV